MLQVGSYRIRAVSGGRFRLDGGSMFGVVPKPLWERVAPPDESNRIDLATNCYLVEGNDQRLLIDTGFGTKLSEKERRIYAAQPEGGLVPNLARAQVAPESIDVVVLSHLHFDHAGGCTMRNESGEIVPTFPNARYVVQQKEWEAATSGLPEWAGTYPEENFRCLESTGQLELIDGEVEIIGGVRGRWTGGHAPGHQVIIIEDGGDGAMFLGDICPTWNHMRRMWCMAYDAWQVDVRRIKPELLGMIADREWWGLSDHDPNFAVARLARVPKQEFTLTLSATRDIPSGL